MLNYLEQLRIPATQSTSSLDSQSVWEGSSAGGHLAGHPGHELEHDSPQVARLKAEVRGLQREVLTQRETIIALNAEKETLR